MAPVPIGPVEPKLDTLINDAITSATYLYDLTDDADLFECGLDSLQVPVLVKEINERLALSQLASKSVSSKMLYQYPSVETLAAALSAS